MKLMRPALFIMAIPALCSCTQQQVDPVAAQPEVEPTQQTQANDEEAQKQQERLEQQDREVALLREFLEADYPLRQLQPQWFGTTARVDALKRRYESGRFDPDQLALDVYAEHEMASTFGFLHFFNREKPEEQLSAEMRQPPRSDDDFRDFKDDLLGLLYWLAVDHRSYVACEILLIQALDGFYAMGYSDSAFNVMAKHPGFVSEVIVTSPYIRRMAGGLYDNDGDFTFYGSIETVPKNCFAYKVLAKPTSLGATADLEQLQRYKAATIAEMGRIDHPVLLKRWQAVHECLEEHIQAEIARALERDNP